MSSNPAFTRPSEMASPCPRKWYFRFRLFGNGIAPKDRPVSTAIQLGIYMHIRATVKSREEAVRRFEDENPSIPAIDPIELDRLEALAVAGMTGAWTDNRHYLYEQCVQRLGYPINCHPDLILPHRKAIKSFTEFKITDTRGIHNYPLEKFLLSIQTAAYFAVTQAEKATMIVLARPLNVPEKAKKGKAAESSADYVERLAGYIRDEPEKYCRRYDITPDQMLLSPNEALDRAVHHVAAYAEIYQSPARAQTLERAFRVACNPTECFGPFGDVCPFVGPCRKGQVFDPDPATLAAAGFIHRPLSPQEVSPEPPIVIGSEDPFANLKKHKEAKDAA